MKSILFATLLIFSALLFLSHDTQAQTPPDQYQLTSESAETDTTASVSTNDTSDYYWKIVFPLQQELNYEIIGEVKQNSQVKTFKIDYPGITSVRTRYLASDSSGYVQGYTKFGWVDIGVFLPGTTADEGDTKIPFSAKTGSAIWAFRLGRKF